MDGKGHNGRLSDNGGPRRRHWVLDAVIDRRRIIKLFKTHKKALLSGFLVAAIIALLFGIASQLQSPSTSNVPSGETSINYSAFLNQVNADNVLAVTIQGNEVNILLQQPAAQANAKKHVELSASQRKAQIADWTRYLNAQNTADWTAQPSDINAARMVYTTLPAVGSSDLVPLLMSKHVAVTTQAPQQTSPWVGLIWKFVPIALMLLMLAVVLKPRKQGMSGLPKNVNEHIAQFTKRRLRRADNTGIGQPGKGQPTGVRSAFKPASAVPAQPPVNLAPPTTFADVAGIDEVRAELEEIVQFLRSPEKYDRLGARIPRGALLVGPPGTGKTLLARAVAGEAGVPFFCISASEFVEMFVGVGASRVRDLFAQARQVAPAVIFIDEIDAVGKKRSMKAMGGNEERDQTLNQLLVEMDGFNASHAVVVLAATNRVDILDKALLRPGRFDRHVTVSLPDRSGRQAILGLHTAKTPLHESVSLERLARMTSGMSGADLANLVNEAALCAARKGLDCVDHECFEDALARVQLGALRPLVMSEAERRIIAYHEGGHALVAHHLKGADTVNRVTILPRGQSLGVTQFVAEEDRYNYSREMLMAKLAVGLGGRVAEELMLGRERVTTGAENDFQVVTGLAKRMVTRWGMSDEVGVVFAATEPSSASLNMRRIEPSAFGSSAQTLAMDINGNLVPNGTPNLERQYTFAMNAPTSETAGLPTLAVTVDREIKKLVDEAHTMARRILEEHFGQLQLLADALMEHEQLDRTAFEALMQA